MSYLQLQNLHKSFGETTVVEAVSLEVEQGELLTFLGPSGCGKTSVLRMIAGFTEADQGRIILEHQDITCVAPNKREVGMVFQSYALFPNFTAAENVGFGLRLRKIPEIIVEARVAELLELVGLSKVAHHLPAQLSGGQQQRVALARVLVLEPRLLLLDEPFSALDAKIRSSLRQLVRDLQQRLGITTIFVTHDQEEALAVSDRIVVMERGKVAQIDTPAGIYRNPANLFVAKFIGLLNIFPATVIDPAKGRIRLQEQEFLLKDPVVGERGAIVQMAVRPETVTVCPLGTSNNPPYGNRLRGRVSKAILLGNIIRLEIDVLDQSFTVDLLNQPGYQTLHKGDEVEVGIPPESLFVVA